MKSEFARLLVLATLIGVAGCEPEKPVSQRSNAEPDPEIAAAEIAAQAEDAEEAARNEILVIRAGHIGKIYPNLTINGAAVGDGKVVSIDDFGVRLQLREGVTEFLWSELPNELREKFGHDADATALLREQAALAAVEPVAAPAAAETENSEATKEIDPQTQARMLALQTQISKISESVQTAKTTIGEAEVFHAELAAIYAAEDEKAAAMKAARVFDRMRRSSCSS